MEMKNKKVCVVGIVYLSLVGDLPDLYKIIVESSSYLMKESPIFRDKFVFPYIALIFPHP